VLHGTDAAASERIAFEWRPPFAIHPSKPMDIATTTATPASTTAATNPAVSAANKAAATHPLILAAALVWLSVDLIGDGLLALRSLMASVTSERTTTPS
jgi:hypothetical protein